MRIEEQITVRADPQAVWELVSDPVSLARALGNGTVAEPVDEGTEPGVRARYRVLLPVGAALVGGEVELIEFDPPRDMAWSAVTGVEHRLRLRVREAGSGCSRVTLRFAYDAPGLLGALADLAALPQIRSLMRQGLQALRTTLEGDAPGPEEGLLDLPRRLAHELVNVRILAQSGLVAPMRPDKLPRLALAFAAYGPTIATAAAAAAIRWPDAPMISDELGELTFAEVDRRTDAIASGLRNLGVHDGDNVGVMCRNHRGFVEAAIATAKAGGNVLLLNTSFAGPQIVEVCKRERPALLIYDEEFTGLLSAAASGRGSVLGWRERDGDVPSLDGLAEQYAGRRLGAPSHNSRVTILTSGTTGTPKGAQRGVGTATLDPPAAILSRIPWRARMRVHIAAPLFHAWGFANLALALGMGSTMVLRRKFSPEDALQAIADERCDGLVVVPVMLQRILELPEEVRARHEVASLRVVAASGSALPGELAIRWMDAFGDNLYNLYGSTEVSAASIATPEDMRSAPGTAGRVPRGTVVRLFDEHGAEVPQGQTGRIFVGSSMLFEGYTGGGSKDRIGGLMATGDVGRFDETGRLFVEGRDDEMIVSGGENVFPKEVEDLLADHPAVAEAAAIGVEDEQFGQRLKAFVVLRDGASADEAELKQHVKEHLARYKVPREIEFLPELPRNATGKILKRELAERR